MGDKDGERIVVKRFHIKNAAVFGLYHGLLVGFVLAVVILIMFFSNVSFMSKLPGALMVSTTSDAFVLAFLVLVSFAVFSFLVSVISAFFYNIVSKMGGPLHFGLIEAERMIP